MLKRYLHGHTLCTEATVQTRSHLIVLMFEISPAPTFPPSKPPPPPPRFIILGPILLPFLPREKCPSALISLASFKLLARKNEAYHQRFFFCLAPAAGMIRRVLSLRVTPHLISSRCSLISQSAGRALFCCHLSLPSRRSKRDEIEHENQMPCVRLALGSPSEGSPQSGGRGIINVVFKSHGHGRSFTWFK